MKNSEFIPRGAETKAIASSQGNCVTMQSGITESGEPVVGIRDSKEGPNGARLVFPSQAIGKLLLCAQQGDLDFLGVQSV